MDKTLRRKTYKMMDCMSQINLPVLLTVNISNLYKYFV